ncbi:MAG: N-acetylmuramoyl-L-alanine amidase [Bdellovibrionales bacterium]|nr:N-acetylmuramoyl-L-alanine amidase [Bdellovibrionales bacterium]
MRNFSALFVSFFFVFFAACPLFAYEIEGEHGYVNPEEFVTGELNIAPPSEDVRHPKTEDRLRKFNLGLKRLGIPEENAPDFFDFPLPGSVSFEEVSEHFRALDPDGALRSYLELGPGGVSLFRDFFSAGMPSSLLDFFLPFRAEGATASGSGDSSHLIARLQRIGTQVKQGLYDHPLAGLRVVIDPGHMGNEEWDQKTGKFVSVGGKTVSEGEIALSTSRLLAGELEALGAEVILTRSKNEPVARTNLETFDPTPFLNQYFYNSLDSWMRPYLALPDARFLSSLEGAPEVKRAFAPSQRTQFFISGEDLEARSRIIDEARADVVIDVHFDASKSNALQDSHNSLEAYVPGGVRTGETGSRVVRSHHLKHLLEVRRWSESVSLASSMIQSMSETLKLPLLNRPEFLTAVRVRDGVYARNLYITRRNLSALMVYLECLHYDHAKEFHALAVNDRIGSYQGETFRYPRRLEAVVAGAKEGILRYFRELPAQR